MERAEFLTFGWAETLRPETAKTEARSIGPRMLRPVSAGTFPGNRLIESGTMDAEFPGEYAVGENATWRSWIAKAWSVCGKRDIPGPGSSPFRTVRDPLLSKAVRIVFSGGIRVRLRDSGKTVENIVRIPEKGSGGYRNIDGPSELEAVLEELMTGAAEATRKKLPEGATVSAMSKALIVYWDASYETFLGSPGKFMGLFHIKPNPDGTVRIPRKIHPWRA